MAKDDIPPLPDRGLLSKRNQLEQALDVHLAMWSVADGLTPSEYRRVAEERERRKLLQKKWVNVGLLLAPEGVTPLQLKTLSDVLTSHKHWSMGQIRHSYASQSVYRLCKSFDVNVQTLIVDGSIELTWKAVVRESNQVYALPRSDTDHRMTDIVRWTRSRNVPVEEILPSGERR
jgi:hypothetical protein